MHQPGLILISMITKKQETILINQGLHDFIRLFCIDKTCSETAIVIYLDLLKKNKLIDLADILIGATALTHSIPLATLNFKHFERIKNLEIYK